MKSKSIHHVFSTFTQSFIFNAYFSSVLKQVGGNTIWEMS